MFDCTVVVIYTLTSIKCFHVPSTNNLVVAFFFIVNFHLSQFFPLSWREKLHKFRTGILARPNRKNSTSKVVNTSFKMSRHHGRIFRSSNRFRLLFCGGSWLAKPTVHVMSGHGIKRVGGDTSRLSATVSNSFV